MNRSIMASLDPVRANDLDGGPSPGWTRIGPRTGLGTLGLSEIWDYRDLVRILVSRDIKVRYKQTALGAAWAIIQPVATMAVFSLFFGYLGGIGERIEGGVPYPLYTFCALLPWQLFSGAITNAGGSLISNQSLITKVYFPRLIVPLASVLGSLVDFLVAFAVLLLMMVGYGISGYAITLSWSLLALPALTALAFLAALAVGLWLAALNVEYRDVRYVIPFLIQFWMFVTPIAYPSSLVRQKSELLYFVYSLNPMVGVVDGFRWALLGNGPGPGVTILVSAAGVGLLLAGGIVYFRSVERTFADVL